MNDPEEDKVWKTINQDYMWVMDKLILLEVGIQM